MPPKKSYNFNEHLRAFIIRPINHANDRCYQLLLLVIYAFKIRFTLQV